MFSSIEIALLQRVLLQESDVADVLPCRMQAKYAMRLHCGELELYPVPLKTR